MSHFLVRLESSENRLGCPRSRPSPSQLTNTRPTPENGRTGQNPAIGYPATFPTNKSPKWAGRWRVWSGTCHSSWVRGLVNSTAVSMDSQSLHSASPGAAFFLHGLPACSVITLPYRKTVCVGTQRGRRHTDKQAVRRHFQKSVN